MNVNSTHKCLLDTMHWVWDLSKFKNRDTKTMSVMSFWCLVNFGQAFAPFLLLLFFTLNIFCLLWMSLNATLWYIFVKHQIDVIFMEVVAKHYIATVPITSPMGCSSQMFFCYFIAVAIGKTYSYCFADFKHAFTIFYHWNRFLTNILNKHI